MDLKDYLNIIISRKWIIIQSIVVVLFITVVNSYFKVPIYEATARIHIDQSGESIFPQNSQQFWSDPDRMLQTQIELLSSDEIAENVIKLLGIRGDGLSLLGQIKVSPVKGTDIIELSVTDEVPERARDIANTYAREYINSRKDQSISQIALAAGQIYAKLEEVKTSQLELAQKISNRKGSDARRLEAEWALSTQLFNVLAEKYEELRIDQALKKGGAVLFSQASIPAAPINAPLRRNIILGFFAGAALGLGIAFLFEHLDNTVKTPADIEKYVNLPTIGQIPSKEFIGKKAKERALAVYNFPKSSTAEAFRGVRNNLKFINYERNIKSILVTSSLPGEGKTTMLSNLAVTLAETGNKVIVICCDLRRPSLHKVFNVDNDIGTTTILVGDITIDKAIKETEIEGLSIIPSGPLPPVPSDLLGSPRLAKLIEEAKERATYVLIDSPPALAVTDASTIASIVDGVILVVSAGNTTIEASEHLKKVFDRTDTKLLGVVLNNIDSVRHYGKYYYYSYSYGGSYLQRYVGRNGENDEQIPKIKT